MYTIRCADAGTAHCKARAQAETMEELMAHVKEHLLVKHGLKATATILKYLQTLVKEV